MKVIYNKFIPFKGFKAITILNFIFVRKEYTINELTISHENIHFEQEKELLFIGFYLWYIIEYLINYIKYNNSYKAYRNISFEKEAYNNQSDFSYYKHRKHYAWLKV